ncbi:MAG: hypothetical protein WCR06_06225 [bacterium]
MTPIPYKHALRCQQKRTVLLVGEGPTEWAFLRHIVGLFQDRAGPVAARVENAHGGAPEIVIATARKLLRQREYDTCLILMDTDRPWPKHLPRKFDRTRLEFIPAKPCLEGLLLRIVAHAGISVNSSVEQCKRVWYETYVEARHKTEPSAYQKPFSKDFLQTRRTACAELDAILRHIA